MTPDLEQMISELLILNHGISAKLDKLEHEIQQLKGSKPASANHGWKGVADAAKLLSSEGIASQKVLADLRRSGVLSNGETRVVNPSATRLTYEYHIERCLEAIRKHKQSID